MSNKPKKFFIKHNKLRKFVLIILIPLFAIITSFYCLRAFWVKLKETKTHIIAEIKNTIRLFKKTWRLDNEQ